MSLSIPPEGCNYEASEALEKEMPAASKCSLGETMRNLQCILALFLAIHVATFGTQAADRLQPRVAIRASRLIDGKGGAPLQPAVVLVEGERIVAVGPALAIPPGTEVIDLGTATLLPGLIDCHTHIAGGDPRNYYEGKFRLSPIDHAVAAHIYARRTLEAGFTTVRDVGANEFVDVALRKAIDAGVVAGPRMQVAALGISATGGHGDSPGFSPYLESRQFSRVADGIDEIRKAVRTRVKYGADWIKVAATAGVLSEEASAGAPQYSQAELDALVEEASMWGKKVAAHAHGAEGIKRAVRAGVASIEHGSLLDDEAIRLMKEKGTCLVSDIYNDDYILTEFARLQYPQSLIDKERQIGQRQRESFQHAARAGVRIVYGTDAGVYPHGWNAKQFAHMVRWGLTPMQAIQAATANAADLLGWSDRIGAVAPGLYADVIAVAGDPLRNIDELERVRFVMKGGQVYKGWKPRSGQVEQSP
jgi:imidazolonepropionase-like amidohydrolase